MFDQSYAIFVVGSQAAKQADQSMGRDKIKSVQILFSDGSVKNCEFFDGFGDLGLASLALSPCSTRIYFSGGDDLCFVDLQTGKVTEVSLPRLIDVHEMDFIESKLYLANTGNDEVISYCPKSGGVERFNIRDVVSDGGFVSVSDDMEDKFHLNQVFKGMDGDLYALVHHIEGKQFLKRVAARVLKSQGNGGCINLKTGKRIPLGLHAPHTVTIVDGCYWVFDSGKALIKIFDEHWELQEEIDTNGWGRGASLLSAGGSSIFAAGLSNIRKRYIHLFENSSEFINGVQLFDVATRSSVYIKIINNIEQVNNVYFVNLDVANAILSMSAKA